MVCFARKVGFMAAFGDGGQVVIGDLAPVEGVSHAQSPWVSRCRVRPGPARRPAGAWRPARNPGVIRVDSPATFDTLPVTAVRSRRRPPTAGAGSGGLGAGHSGLWGAGPGGVHDSAAAARRY